MKKLPLGTSAVALIAILSFFFITTARPQAPPAAEPEAIADSVEEPQPGDRPPGFMADDVSPTESTDVSTMITTGGGYDAWTGAVRRVVTDLDVPGAVSSHGLKIVRTYTSSTGLGWSFSWTWQVHARPFTSDGSYLINFPDGRAVSFYPPSIPGETAYRAGRGTKERFVRNNPGSEDRSADLYLEDGSHVHFDWIEELSADDQYPIDYFFPETFTDPYGRVTIIQYTQYGTEYNETHLTKVIDQSGRSLTYNYDETYGLILTSIVASTGQSVTYNADGSVTYSDGTSANYTSAETSYKGDDSICPQGICHAHKLTTANDVRAEGPMRSIEYTYIEEANFQGQVHEELHAGVAVSIFQPTNGRGSTTATNVEVRGDGPSRRFDLIKDGNTPLLQAKSDFNGVEETFHYDPDRLYLDKVTDRRGAEVTYDNEVILGRPLTVTHPDTGDGNGTSTTVYRYSFGGVPDDTAHPYYVYSVKDDNNHTTYYDRDSLNRITQIRYPDGGTETFDYNSLGQATRHKRQNGYYEHAEYDETGLLTTLWSPTLSDSLPSSGPKTTFTYYDSSSPCATG